MKTPTTDQNAGVTVGAQEDVEFWSVEEAEAVLAQLAAAFFQAPASDAPRRRSTRIQTDGSIVTDEPTLERHDPPAVVTLDDAGRVLALDAAAERIFGWPTVDALGQPAAILLGDAQAAVDLRAIGASPVLRTGRRRDGATFAMELTARPLDVAERRLWLLVAFDVTERRRVEAERRKAESRYRALVEQIPAVTFSASLEGGLNEIYIGPQVEALLGYSQEEWLADPTLWFRQLHPDDQERWNAEFTRGCATGGPFRADCRFIARDGHTVWVHGEARVVRDDDGRPLFVQGVAFDITEIKNAEEKLREAQDALVRNEKMAALGQLAATVGHELRNPLAAIRNAWFVVRKRLPDEKLAAIDEKLPQVAALVLPELNRCGKIIGELLDFARERPPYCVATPVRKLVEDAFALVAAPATVKLDNQVPDDLPVPYLDQDQMKQVLVNLAQNAAEAVDPENGSITVVATAGDSEIELRVVDNGKGMSDKVQTRIFEPLYTTKLRGTGLGLAIVASIVRRHQGTIDVASEVGRGTTFTLRLPLGSPSAGPEPSRGGAVDLRG